jgi:hypothetical protein
MGGDANCERLDSSNCYSLPKEPGTGRDGMGWF